MWETIKSAIWKYGGSLVCGENGQGAFVSLGRLAFLILFGLAFWMWAPFLGGAEGKGLPGDMFSMLLTLAGYNLGSKMVQTTKEILAARKAPEAPPAPAEVADAPVAG
jgi:hypothetical protein